jgi:hypothetical protein
MKREPLSIDSLSFADRARKAIESHSLANEERVEFLEAHLKEAKFISEDADIKYDEVIFAWVGCCACIMTSRPPLYHPYAARPTLSRLPKTKPESLEQIAFCLLSIPFPSIKGPFRFSYSPSKFITKTEFTHTI